MVNINDVAKHAGVSKSTVSKVLHNYDTLSKETVKKVHEAINELGYVPNQTASSLSQKNLKKIGVIHKINDSIQTIDEINMRYLLGIDHACVKNKVETSIIFADVIEEMSATEILNYLRSKSITALIIVGLSKDDENLQELINMEQFPTVITETHITNKVTSSVSVNNFEAQYKIARENIELRNAEKILYLAGKDNAYVADERTAAIKQVAEDLSLDIDIISAEFSEQKAYQIVSNLEEDYDMIISASDLMTVGAKRALIAKEEFVDLVSFDGIKLLSYVGEDIPTVQQNFYKIGCEAVHEALRLLSGEKARTCEIPYSIGFMTNENI